MPRNAKSQRLGRVWAIRDQSLVHLRRHGEWERWQCNGRAYRFLTMRLGSIYVLHSTPFQRGHTATEPQLLGRMLAGAWSSLPYGLDIWDEKTKVLNVEWNAQDTLEIISYRRGAWENEYLQ